VPSIVHEKLALPAEDAPDIAELPGALSFAAGAELLPEQATNKHDTPMIADNNFRYSINFIELG
jgi:hypothetical protein